MNLHTIKVLEFDRIVDKLHSLCWSVPAKRIEILPLKDVSAIENTLDCLSELVEIYHVDGGPPGLQFGDIDLMVERCAAEGAVLEPSELVNVADLYYIVKGFVELDAKYKNLHKLIARLDYDEALAAEIENTVQRPNEIKDSASSLLRDIRRRIGKTRNSLEAKYNSYLESDYSKYLTDKIVTFRDGRFVLPVREGDKGRIKGVVHDRSSTGVTFFVEPFDAVDLNNAYRELLAAEKQEIYRILRALTDKILARLQSIKQNIQVLIQLDIYSAKARFAVKLNCHRPFLNTDGVIDIKTGYHPLLLWRDKEQGTDNTIPLDMSLGKDFTTLIITGPNTGGKTVTLKTVGLLCMMAQSGMFIPAKEGTTLNVLSDIYADIGDEQSLEASLSTFSAHLANIKNALDNAGDDCLVLLDEIGAGTDPDEGSALGQAIVEYLAERRLLSIVTTHHGKLKTLAVNHANIENGSLDFDTQKMRPSYKFRLGVPGLSYAIETARKLGINESVTARAEALLDRSERKLAGIISELTEKLRETDEKLTKAEANRLSYESLAQLYTSKLENFEKEKKQIKKRSLEESEQLIRNAKKEINELIDEAKRSTKKVESLRTVKHLADEKIIEIHEQVKKIEPQYVRPEAEGKLGEKVYLPEMQASGEIVEAPDAGGRVRVKIGNIVLITDMNKLFKASGANTNTEQFKSSSAYLDVTPSLEVDLRGMTFDEAQPVLDRYLEDVYLAGLGQVTIIHGKGTGALKTKIQNHLKKHPHVKTFRLGQWNEGSYGVTIVEIKKD